MGVTHVTVSISNLAQSGPKYEADFLVDTGAVDCMAPRDRLVEAGIRPEGKAVYELANGQPVEYEYGFARVSFVGAETVAQIIFGPPDTEPILGVTALESVGIEVDPQNQRLKRMPATRLKSMRRVST